MLSNTEQTYQKINNKSNNMGIFKNVLGFLKKNKHKKLDYTTLQEADRQEMVERSKMMEYNTNGVLYKKFIIPVQQYLAEADYKDQISFDDTTGEIMIDGSKNLPYSKEYWF